MTRSARARLLPATARAALVRRRPAPRQARFCFGRLDPASLAASPRLDVRMPATLPTPPAALNWAQRMPASLGMMLNNRIGDCTCAAVGHAVQVMTANAGTRMITIPDAAILRAYEAITGYDPVTGVNDNGAVEANVLEYWRRSGVGGHPIAAYGRVDHADELRLRQTIDLFGFAYMGTRVPAGWEQAPPVWDVCDGPAGQIVGGHAIIYVGYGPGFYWLISWGRLYKITAAAHARYVDEAWGVLSRDWIRRDRLAPSGVDWGGLLGDLPELGH